MSDALRNCDQITQDCLVSHEGAASSDEGNCPVITHGNLYDKDSRDILPMQRLPSTLINPSVEQYMIYPKHCCWDIEIYNRTDFSQLINAWRISTTPQAVAQAEHKSTRGWIRDTELSIALQKGSDIRLIFAALELSHEQFLQAAQHAVVEISYINDLRGCHTYATTFHPSK